jgi:hypothetical protein
VANRIPEEEPVLRGPGGPLKEGASMLRTGLIKIVGALVVLSQALPVYTANKFPDYPVRQAGEYDVTAERAGVTIGVQPVEDLKDQKTYFDVELTPKGFVPVFIVIQNATGSDSFLFQKTNIGYGGVSNSPTPNIRSKVGDTMAYLGPGLIAMKLITNATKVQENILKKEVQSKTLSPGTSVHGFLYIPAPKNGPREKIHLQVPITRAGTSETFVLNLTF